MAQDHEAAHEKHSRRSASQDYPEDRFDAIPQSGRVGAHRVTAQPRVAWHFVLGGLIGAVLLTTIGVVGVTIANSTGKLSALPSQQGTPAAPKVKPELNPEATIVLLDGSPAAGEVAQRIATTATAEKWGVVVFAGPASSADVEISAVFYSDEADAAAAAALAQKLGGVSTYLSTDYNDYEAALVVLIGSDYAGPGKDAE